VAKAAAALDCRNERRVSMALLLFDFSSQRRRAPPELLLAP
jgi:hypothetical protein